MAIPCLTDSDTVHLSQDGSGALVADVTIDPAADNLLTESAAGLRASYYPALVSTLPSTPADGQVVSYQADAASGAVWSLRYNASSASTYKWEWIGGSDLYVLVLTTESRASAAYGALATPVEVILPANVSGDYQVDHGAMLNASSDGNAFLQTVKLGAAAATSNEACQNGNTRNASVMTSIRGLGIAAGATLALVYSNTGGGGTGQANHRWMKVRPVRLVAV